MNLVTNYKKCLTAVLANNDSSPKLYIDLQVIRQRKYVIPKQNITLM